MPMTNDQLCQRLREAEADAIQFNSTFGQINEENLNYYLGKPFGNEVDGQSSVVSTDVQDVVESDMPSLARVFLGSGDIVTFQPNSENEREIQEAEEKTKYINHIVRHQPESYATIHGWLKDSEIQTMGVVKYGVEDIKTTKEIKFTGLSELEIEQTKEDLDGKDVKSIDIVKEDERDRDDADDEPTFDITFKVTTKRTNRAFVKGVPTENFLITRRSETLEDAEIVGDVMLVTRSDLLAMGVSPSDIKKIPRSGERFVDDDQMKRIRFGDEGNNSDPESQDFASEKVELHDLYAQIDFDQDGIAERRRVLKSRYGDVIIINDPYDHVPYAVISSMLMPHSVMGRSRTEITKSNQLVKSTVLRGSLNNLYLTNNARTVVNDENVNIDDMLTVRPGGMVRTTGIPAQDVSPLVVQSVITESLGMIQYLDFARAQSTGTLMASQGLDADALTNETATRFNGMQDEGTAKIELVARGIAETGFRKLYEGLAWTVSQFQDSATEIMVLGKQLTVNPGRWKFDHKVKSEVGLGAGDNEKLLSTLSGIYQLQQQLKAQGSPLVDDQDMFNTLARIVKGSGLPRVDEFFNDASQPDEVILANNEKLILIVQQLQQQVEALQNPLAEAETIRAQEKAQSSQAKNQLELVKAQDKRKQFDISEANEMKKHNDQIAVDLTKLEVDSGQDIPGSTV